MKSILFLVIALATLNGQATARANLFDSGVAGTSIHSPHELTTAIIAVADDIFEWHEEDEKKAWLGRMVGKVNSLEYTYCLTEQVQAIHNVMDKLFDWTEEEERQGWVKARINDILTHPTFDCGAAASINTILLQRDQQFDWTEEEEGKNWARNQIAALF